MKVELLRAQNVPAPRGAVVDVDEVRAKWLVSVGAAKFVELPKKEEKKSAAKKTKKKD